MSGYANFDVSEYLQKLNEEALERNREQERNIRRWNQEIQTLIANENEKIRQQNERLVSSLDDTYARFCEQLAASPYAPLAGLYMSMIESQKNAIRLQRESNARYLEMTRRIVDSWF